MSRLHMTWRSLLHSNDFRLGTSNVWKAVTAPKGGEDWQRSCGHGTHINKAPSMLWSSYCSTEENIYNQVLTLRPATQDNAPHLGDAVADGNKVDPEGKLGSHVGQRVACGLRREGRRAAQPSVNLFRWTQIQTESKSGRAMRRSGGGGYVLE